MAELLMNSNERSSIRRKALPLFVSKKDKYSAGFAIFIGALVLYLLSNHFQFFQPQQLQRSWVDQAVPFLPNSLWIYLSEYVFFITVYLMAEDVMNLNKYLYSFAFLQITSCLIFTVWPTTYPRDLFPLPSDLNAVTHFAFESLRKTDSPASCCPSLHVSSVFLSAFIYRDEKKKLFPFFFVWATAITVSTLTTKQHYLVDVVAGFWMAVGHYWFFHRYMRYEKTT